MNNEIRDAIRAAVASMTKPDLIIGKVTAFNQQDWTIDVDLNSGGSVPGATIKSVLNSEASGIFVRPIVGSNVLLGLTDGKLENLTVLVYAEIEEIRYMPSMAMQLMGDTHGGLAIVEKIANNLDAIKNYLAAEKSAISAALTAVGVGSAANGPAGASAFNTSMASQTIVFEDMENQNVKHG